MNLISTKEKNVVNIEDRSDESMERMRITFKNGLGISIIQGQFSYGGDEGFFEIAGLDKDGHLTGLYFDKADSGDTVLGYCDEEKVKYYIDKISNFKKRRRENDRISWWLLRV